MAPPGVSLPGPFVTVRYRTALATYLVGEFEQRFLHGSGPAQVGFGFTKTAPFIYTERSVPATHANIEVWNRYALTFQLYYKSIKYLTLTFDIHYSIFDIRFLKFLFRSDRPLFRPAAGLTPETFGFCRNVAK